MAWASGFGGVERCVEWQDIEKPVLDEFVVLVENDPGRALFPRGPACFAMVIKPKKILTAW
jgi:hypothetical protein